MKIKLNAILFVLNALFLARATAQTELERAFTKGEEQTRDTLIRYISVIRSELDVLKKIKLTGYIQAQYQTVDSAGAKTYAGGDFAPGVNNRFMIRRGRLKLQYESNITKKGWSLSNYVLQFDVSERGVTIMDAYAKFTDPWTGWFSLTAGMQNRPFGYEVSYSSSLRESPERGRMSQIIFPNERDLGALFTIQGPEKSKWNWLKINAGFFNGTGAPGAGMNTADFDKFKDFIGQIHVSKPNEKETIKWSVGISYYNGGYRIDSFDTYKFSSDGEGIKAFEMDEQKANVSSDIAQRHKAPRNYYGADAQFSIDWLAGIMTLRAEFITGEQSGTAFSTTSPNTHVATDVYRRKFNGAYFYFLQNIAQTPLQAVVKYDWYDPNTELGGDEIGRLPTGSGFKKTGAADIKYTTVGLGLVYQLSSNLKFMAYYDIVKNETSKNLSGYSEDLKDNVFTLRMQISGSN